MPSRTRPASSRVLGFFPDPRRIGRVVIDGFGLPRDGGFMGFDLRPHAGDAAARVDELARASLRRFRPALVAIGTSRRGAALAARIAAVSRAADVPVLRIDARRARDDLLGDSASVRSDVIAEVVTAFLPELAARVCRAEPVTIPGRRPTESFRRKETRRVRAPVWKAAAVALWALIRAHPRSAAALLRGELPRGSPIPMLIAAAERRRVYPPVTDLPPYDPPATDRRARA